MKRPPDSHLILPFLDFLAYFSPGKTAQNKRRVGRSSIELGVGLKVYNYIVPLFAHASFLVFDFCLAIIVYLKTFCKECFLLSSWDSLSCSHLPCFIHVQKNWKFVISILRSETISY